MLTAIVVIAVAIVGLVIFMQSETPEEANEEITLITPNNYVNDFDNETHQLIDVRTNQEFEEGYIDGAVNIPLQQIETRFSEISKDEPIVLYCRSGNRSAQAAQILKDAGYTNIYDLGGTLQWTNAGFDLTVSD